MSNFKYFDFSGNATKAILGAHSRIEITNQQQVIRIKRAIKYPCFNKDLKINDLQLLQVRRTTCITLIACTSFVFRRKDHVKIMLVE